MKETACWLQKIWPPASLPTPFPSAFLLSWHLQESIEHRKILKQRLPDTAKGARGARPAERAFSFSACVPPVPAASPEHSERNITLWQPFSCWGNIKQPWELPAECDCTCRGRNLQILLPFGDHSLIFQGCHSDEDLQRACQGRTRVATCCREGN